MSGPKRLWMLKDVQKSHSQIPSLASVASLVTLGCETANSHFLAVCLVAYWPNAQCVCVPGLTELFIHKPDPFLFVQISFLIALLSYDNSVPGLEDLPSPTGHSRGWCTSVAGDKGTCHVWDRDSSWAAGTRRALQDSLGLKNHRGIEGLLFYRRDVGRSKRERKDQLPWKERGRESSPAGLTHCSLAAKNCTAFAFPLPCGKFMNIIGEIISWLYCGLWDTHILHFF